jgi:hypothetical protein
LDLIKCDSTANSRRADTWQRSSHRRQSQSLALPVNGVAPQFLMEFMDLRRANRSA